MTAAGDIAATERTDAFLGGRLSLRQPARGHRSGTDAVLLAAAPPAGFAGRAADLGAGVGAVGLSLALREPGVRMDLVEIDRDLCRLAAENVAANGLSGRVAVIEVDLLGPGEVRRAAGLASGSMDLVLTNPPFDEAGRGRPSPDPAKRRAHVSDTGDLETWFGAAADMLRHKGLLVAILRADGLPRALSALGRAYGGLTVLPVHPRAAAPATRILLRAVRGSRAPLSIVPGLVLHADDGRFTPTADALHRGEAILAW